MLLIAKSRSKRTPAPLPKRPRRLWLNMGVAVLTLAALVATVVMSSAPDGTHAAPVEAKTPAPSLRITSDADLARYSKLSACDLVAMSDTQLEAMDPLVMNMVVAKGLPELASIDFAKYARTVDEWADRISAGLAAQEPEAAATSLSYKADRNIWRAGGMAIAVAGPSIGIRYSRSVSLSKHSDLFVPGMIDAKEGTCSNMPVLHMAVGWRLGWPLKAVVTRDHMWSRWDDGKPGPRDHGSYFNLEATATEKGGDGYSSFATPPDESYIKDFRTPKAYIDAGSDLATLTMRQTLGVFLQQRAAYWLNKGNVPKSRADIELAARCFPENVDIRNALARSSRPEPGKAGK